MPPLYRRGIRSKRHGADRHREADHSAGLDSGQAMEAATHSAGAVVGVGGAGAKCDAANTTSLQAGRFSGFSGRSAEGGGGSGTGKQPSPVSTTANEGGCWDEHQISTYRLP